MVPNPGIVAHMGIGHKQIVATYLSDTTAMVCATIHRHMFPKDIPSPYLKASRLSPILEILRVSPDDCMRVNGTRLSQGRLAIDNSMRPNAYAIM